jgi:sugar diacid utilization regulator/GAF domain-containing protein
MERRTHTATTAGTDIERSLSAALQISQVINLSLDLRDMFQRLAETVHSLIGYDCAVVLIEPKTMQLKWMGSYGLSPQYVAAMNAGHNHLRAPGELQGTMGRAFVSLRSEQLTDLDDPRVERWRDDARREGIVTVISTPMILRKCVLGFITCYTRYTHRYSSAEIDLLTLIANQAAIAVEAAELHDHVRQRVHELQDLNDRLADQHDLLRDQHELLQEQHAQLLRAEHIHRELTEALLQDSGLNTVVKRIAELVGRPVALYDSGLKRIGSANLGDPVDELERSCRDGGRVPRNVFANPGANRLLERLRDEGRPVRFEATDLVDAGFSRFFAPISTGRSVLGYLEVVEFPDDISGLALRAVEHGTTVIAMELLKQRAVLQAEQQLRGSFLDDLLAGNLESDDAIRRRAGFVGFDLGIPYRILVFGVGLEAADDQRGSGPSVDTLRQRLESAIAISCKSRFPGAAVTLRGDAVVVLWPEVGVDRTAVIETARTLIDDANATLRGMTISVGVGSTCSRPADFVHAFREARYCLDLLQRFGTGSRVLTIEMLGLQGFLLRAQGDDQLLAFAHRKLDRLVAEDDKHDRPLLHTLASYLRSDCSLTRTAREMVLHVNTVQYRIRRVERLTETALASPEGLMELQLALLVASLSPREFPAIEPIAVSRLHGPLPESAVGSRAAVRVRYR